MTQPYDPEQPETIAFDAAVAQLPDGAEIHTFRNPVAAMLIGADWPRDKLISAMRAADAIQVTGAQAQAIHHGLAIEHGGGVLFIATKADSQHGLITGSQPRSYA